MEGMTSYNVIVGCGYVEECHPARLLLNYFVDEDEPALTAKDVAKQLLETLSAFVKQDTPKTLRSCCKKAKPKDNYCSKCGQPIVSNDEAYFELEDRITELFRETVSGTLDSIESCVRGHDNFYEYMESNGWLLCGSLVNGPVVEITSFDRYIEDENSCCVEFMEGSLTVKGFERAD